MKPLIPKGLPLKKRVRIPGIVIGALLLFALFTVLKPDRFLTYGNIMLIAKNSSILALASIGMTIVILTSQVDLSIGSTLSFAGVLVAVLYSSGVPAAIAILLALASGMVIGLINGIFIAKYNYDYWLVSFAMMGIVAGLALVLADGKTVAIQNKFLDFIGSYRILGINIFTIITVILLFVMMFVLGKTRFGLNIYSIGGSEQVSALSGINVMINRISVYVLSGFFAALSGIFLTSMAASASPIAGSEYSFTSMAAVIIGGTSFAGGKGGLMGTVFGVLLLRILASGLNYLGLPASAQKAVIGFVIVFILVFDAINTRSRRIKEQRRKYSCEITEK